MIGYKIIAMEMVDETGGIKSGDVLLNPSFYCFPPSRNREAWYDYSCVKLLERLNVETFLIVKMYIE